jgi:DNA-binding NarL/FixJ family response regulator
MGEPSVLVVCAHPGIGSGIETVLRLEGRYAVKWVRSLAEATTGTWRPDAVLVDGALVDRQPAELSAPALVLAANSAEGRALTRVLVGGRGWLRKDATASELVAAIDSLLGAEAVGSRPIPVRALLASAGALTFGSLGVFLLWSTLRP